MVKFLHWIDDKLSVFENIILVILLLTMVILSFSLVILRNFFDTGISGADELLRHLVLLVAFFGASQAARLEKHINVDVLTNLFKHSAKPYVRIIVNGVSLAITAFLAHAAWEFVMIERSFGSQEIFGITTWVFQLVIPVGFFLIGYRFLLHFLDEIVLLINGGKVITILGITLIILALFGTPLFIIIGGLTFLLYVFSGYPPAGLFIELYTIATFPTLLAIPLFTFAGYMLAESNTPKRIINITSALLGWMPGGLAVVALCACAFFTAFSGASGVTIIALGGLLYPVMLKDHYEERFSLGLLTTSGSLGLLFPPSLPIILYAMIAGTSIDNLFLAGIIPGIVLILLLSLYSMYANKNKKTERQPFSWFQLWNATKNAAWEIPLPFIIIFGIYGGYVTATEAAAITAFYVLVVEVFIYRDLHIFHDVPKIMKESMVLVGSILVIMGLALGLTGYLTGEEIPQKILALMQNYITSKVMFLIVLNIFLLVVGFLMDIFSALFVVVPLILPIATQFGVDPVHLGIIFLTNLEIGYSTPPVGLNLFIASFRFNKPVIKLYRAAVPFIVIMLIALIIITYIPSLSLYLVEMFGR